MYDIVPCPGGDVADLAKGVRARNRVAMRGRAFCIAYMLLSLSCYRAAAAVRIARMHRGCRSGGHIARKPIMSLSMSSL